MTHRVPNPACDWVWVEELTPEQIAYYGGIYWRVDSVDYDPGPAPVITRVFTRNPDGTPIVSAHVVFSWPGGFNQQYTGPEGFTDFGMGKGATFWPQNGERGPHWVTVAQGVYPSEIVSGIGLPASHDVKYVVNYTLVGAGSQPPQPPEGEVQVLSVSFDSTTVLKGQPLTVRIKVKNDSTATVTTQGPPPGTVYKEDESYKNVGGQNFDEVKGALRFGAEDAARDVTKYPDHQWRWGFGTSLAAGEEREVTGQIIFNTVGTRHLWVGLVKEQVAWLADNLVDTVITITDQPVPPQPGPDLTPRVVKLETDVATLQNNVSALTGQVSTIGADLANLKAKLRSV